MGISDSASSHGGTAMLWCVTSLTVTRTVSFVLFCVLCRKSGGHNRWLCIKREKFCLFLMLTERKKTTTKKKTQSYAICVFSVMAKLCDPMDFSPPGSSVHGDSPGKNTEMGCHFLLPGVFPTQGSNPGLPHCRRILYHLSHQGSPSLVLLL